jgi:uncharacterized membrane protein
MPTRKSPWRTAARIAAAVFFTAAGLNHFRNPRFYREIIPPFFGNPAPLVIVSGIAEIARGLGLLVESTRRLAGWGLIALLIAVFPANVFMSIAPEKIPDMHFPLWALWLRLPLQAVFIAWIWFSSLSPGQTENAQS